jgi:hypothetical protein
MLRVGSSLDSRPTCELLRVGHGSLFRAVRLEPNQGRGRLVWCQSTDYHYHVSVMSWKFAAACSVLAVLIFVVGEKLFLRRIDDAAPR